jgi:hypothetical protein
MFGGAVAAGPKAAVKLAPIESFSALEMSGINVPGEILLPDADSVSGARKALKKMLMRTPQDIARRKSGTPVYGLHPDIHALRSVSLTAKVRKMREYNFNRDEERERNYFNGIIEGWWS